MKTTVLFSILFVSLCSAQTPSWTWVQSSPVLYTELQADKYGNIYSAGISDTGSNNKVYIRKFTSTGTVLWEKILLQHNPITKFPLGLSGLKMVTHPDGFSYIAVTYYGKEVNVDGMTLSSPVKNQTNVEVLIVKINTNGQAEWGQQFGTMYHEFISDLDLTPDGGIVVYGQYTGEELVVGSFTLPQPYYENIFSVKLDPKGQYEWAEAMDYGWDNPIGTAVDGAGFIYQISGINEGVYKLVKRGHDGKLIWIRDMQASKPFHFMIENSLLYATDYFGVQIFDTSGTKLSEKQINGININDFKVSGGQFYYAGDFYESMSAGNLVVTNTYTYESGRGPKSGSALWVSKVDGNGEVTWLKDADGDCFNSAKGILHVPGGATYVSGTASSTLNFDGNKYGPDSTWWNFIAKLDENNPVGIKTIEKPHSMLLYPNPAKNTISISATNLPGIADIKIYDCLGNCVYSETFNSREKQIDVSAWSKGVYMVSMHTNNLVYVNKLIVQ